MRASASSTGSRRLNASIPIATVEQLDTWQGYYEVLKVLVWLGPLLVIAFGAAGAWLVRDLALAGLWFSGAGLLALVGATVGVSAVLSGAPTRLADPVAADAARAVLATFTGSLVRNVTVVGLVLAVLLAVSAWFFAFRRTGGAGRRRRGLSRNAQGRVASAGSTLTVSTAGLELLAHDDVGVHVQGVEREDRHEQGVDDAGDGVAHDERQRGAEDQGGAEHRTDGEHETAGQARRGRPP